jgi:hypothetical protein
MTGCQADTFKRKSLILFRQTVCSSSADKKIDETSFFISCAKCLWDVVRRFLGSFVWARDARGMGFGGVVVRGGAMPLLNHFK